MKRIILSATMLAFMVILPACQKEIPPYLPEPGTAITVSINSEIGEFQNDDTKSQALSVFRINWEANDAVYVYDNTGASLGTLVATPVDGYDGALATLSGTITAPAADSKLYLVHSSLLSSAPVANAGKISIDLSSQSTAGRTDFVAYAIVDYNATTISNLHAKFEFASSVIKVNATGLGEGVELSSATLDNIETIASLTISADGISVGGEAEGTITKTLSGSTSAEGLTSFYMAVPDMAASTSHNLTVKQSDNNEFIKSSVIKTAHSAGSYVNTICVLLSSNAYVENGVCLGMGVEIDGLVWAPVNCGTDETHPYGLLYQWNRKYGQGYSGETPACTVSTTAPTLADGNKEENKDVYYAIAKNWYSDATSTDVWYQYSPCPNGWRVPSVSEVEALYAHDSGWKTNVVVNGVSMNGFYVCGSKTYASSVPQIFLPAAGYAYIQSSSSGISVISYSRSTDGRYWTCSPSGSSYSPDSVYSFYFYSSYTPHLLYSGKGSSYSVRCVKE